MYVLELFMKNTVKNSNINCPSSASRRMSTQATILSAAKST